MKRIFLGFMILLMIAMTSALYAASINVKEKGYMLYEITVTNDKPVIISELSVNSDGKAYKISISADNKFSEKHKLTADISQYNISGSYYFSVVCKDIEGLVKMIDIPSGSFMRGDYSDKHRVTINSFKIGKYEVTQGLWEAVMGSNPSNFKGNPNFPVEQVNWNDFQEFIEKLNEMTGKKYRLPTEAEWEYAARANQSYEYAGSDNIDAVAWYNKNSGSKTHPVGQKQANGFGLYDMSGNVWEWCQDWYHSNCNVAPIDGSAWEYPTGSDRVVRGGCWSNRDFSCRSADRNCNDPSSRNYYDGFRLVRTE